jgi:hypothetical protein
MGSMLKSPIHSLLFFGILAYLIVNYGSDLLFFGDVGKLYFNSFLSDPVGTINFILKK